MVFGENFKKQVAERKALEVKTEIKAISENPFYKSIPKRQVIKTWQDYITDLSKKRMEGLVKQKDIAELTGLDTGYISRFFSAKKSPSLKTYATIANAIDRLSK